MNRRSFHRTIAATLLSLGGRAIRAGTTSGESDRVGDPLKPWTPGCLDIHHIDTGRGNATLMVMPDGTSILVDAGASVNAPDVSAAPRPSAERRPGVWIARYAQRHLRATGAVGLDYMLVTHLHPDHLGDIDGASPVSADGTYRLTGVSDVAALLPVGTLLDRDFPTYDYPTSQLAPFAVNYRAFVRSRLREGGRVERYDAGRDDQVRPVGRFNVPTTFAFRNVAANGRVWTGNGAEVRATFPPLAGLSPGDFPTENMCSTALRLTHGRFAYFTGGDLTSYTNDGALPWQDILGAAARAAGPVDVATADHHGLFDGLNGDVVRALRPQVWIVQAWHLSHPDTLQLERMLSERLYPGSRDVFATSVMPGNALMNRRLMQRVRSTVGHVIIRVLADTLSFSVVVTGNDDEQDLVRMTTGPYPTRGAPRTPTT